MDDPSNKHFRMVPFSVHATRGLLRDQKARRKAIGISLVAAVAMLTAGLTVLRSWLDRARASVAICHVLVRLRVGNDTCPFASPIRLAAGQGSGARGTKGDP